MSAIRQYGEYIVPRSLKESAYFPNSIAGILTVIFPASSLASAACIWAFWHCFLCKDLNRGAFYLSIVSFILGVLQFLLLPYYDVQQILMTHAVSFLLTILVLLIKLEFKGEIESYIDAERRENEKNQ